MDEITLAFRCTRFGIVGGGRRAATNQLPRNMPSQPSIWQCINDFSDASGKVQQTFFQFFPFSFQNGHIRKSPLYLHSRVFACLQTLHFSILILTFPIVFDASPCHALGLFGASEPKHAQRLRPRSSTRTSYFSRIDSTTFVSGMSHRDQVPAYTTKSIR